MDFIIMTLQQHFSYSGCSAKIRIDLKYTSGIEQVRGEAMHKMIIECDVGRVAITNTDACWRLSKRAGEHWHV